MDKPEQVSTDVQWADQVHNEVSDDSEEELLKDEAQLYVTDPHEFLSICQKDKKIKIMDECNPIMNNVYLKDISLHKKGPLEDKIYSKNTFYYCNIRRGNTLCQVYDEKQQEAQLFMCRRGMKKFYDLEPEYLKINRKLTHQHERFRRRIFEKLDQFAGTLEQNENSCVHLYGIFKENGEHCQITFVKQLGYWLFASKNVSILAKTQDDLECYQKERFYWARLIGHQFFKILGNFNSKQLQQFIVEIDGKTLLGEHCGHEKHQHITKYEKVEIIFYGLVETTGKEHCLPVSQCQKFLNKYGLRMSKMQTIERLRQKNKIYLSMYKMLKKVAEGSMSESGEGSVLYIVGEDGFGQQKTIGMCKLKTCEYLIYRKMREMIKIYFAKKGATANNFDKFRFEVNSLCKNYFFPPKPIEYYEIIAQRGFHEVKKNQKNFSDDEFRYKFVNFLQSIEKKVKAMDGNPNSSVEFKRIILIAPPLLVQETSIIEEVCKKLNIQIQYSYRQISEQKLSKSILHILHMVPRLNLEQMQPNVQIIAYESTQAHSSKTIQQLEHIQDIKKSHLISFIKSQNKKRSIQLLKQKIQAFVSASSQKNKVCERTERKVRLKRARNLKDIINEIEETFTQNPTTDVQKMNKTMSRKCKFMVYVIITLLIPGSGKSSLVQTIKQQYPNLNLQVISSDKIRQGVMEKYKSKRKGQELEIQQSYSATKKKGLEKYREAVMRAVGEEAPSESKILFIDRVFCPTTVLENMKEISRDWTKFIILAQSENSIKLNDYIYPHSLNYLLWCIKRSLQRTGHQTLSQKPNEIVKVILKFFQMYRGFSYFRFAKQIQNSSLQFQILPLEFVKESNSSDNLFLKKKLEECLKGISPGHQPPESPLYAELIEMIYKYSQHIEPRNEEDQEKQKQQTLGKNALKVLEACT